MTNFGNRPSQEKGSLREGDCEHNAECRCAVFDRADCTNGPDEDGNWPCDPAVLFGSREAECQTCGRVAAWGAGRA